MTTSTTQLSMFGGSPADVPADDLRDGLRPQAFDRALFDTVAELRLPDASDECAAGLCKRCPSYVTSKSWDRGHSCGCVCHEVERP